MANHNPKSSQWITELFETACRSAGARQIGMEIERIAIWDDFSPFLYQEKMQAGKLRPGAEQLLSELGKRNPWPMTLSSTGRPVGLTSPYGKVTLEPGSQVELSGDPQKTLFEVADAAQEFEEKVSDITSAWGLNWIGIGVNPVHTVAELDLIPSPRYEIMTRYFEERGRLGTSMMRKTSSIQLNLDYTSEKEAIEMLRTALAVSPISYALFANSPFSEKKQTDYLTYRSQIWRETDPFRTGLLPEAFAKDFSFSAYADYLWNRPLMFAQDTRGIYVAANGASLNDIQAGKVPGVHLDEANQWNAVRELFTEARIKQGYIEIRNIDGQLPRYRMASAAFWVGLLYNSEARDLALKLLGGIDPKDRNALWIECSKKGFNVQSPTLDLKDITRVLIAAAHAGLKARGFGEEVFMNPVQELFEEKSSPGEILVREFNNSWNKRIEKVVEAVSFRD